MMKGEIRFIGSVIKAEENEAIIQIYERYCKGLLGIEQYSHLIVLYWLHERDNEQHRSTLQVIPSRHGETTLRGVYACRSPSRPNPIGLTVVELLMVDDCKLFVKGLDAIKDSPIVDIKPYSPRADSYEEAKTPDWSKRGPPF